MYIGRGLNVKTETLTPQDAALWLARNPRKRKDGRKRLRSDRSSENDLADDLLRNFSVRSLHAALVDDKGQPINIKWYVKKLLSIFARADQQRDRLAVLDRLQSLILLGAIQDREFIESLSRKVGGLKPVGSEGRDPFAERGNLKLRAVSTVQKEA